MRTYTSDEGKQLLLQYLTLHIDPNTILLCAASKLTVSGIIIFPDTFPPSPPPLRKPHPISPKIKHRNHTLQERHPQNIEPNPRLLAEHISVQKADLRLLSAFATSVSLGYTDRRDEALVPQAGEDGGYCCISPCKGLNRKLSAESIIQQHIQMRK